MDERVTHRAAAVNSFPGSVRAFRHYVNALRVHQWAKNVLVFVPVVTSHQVLNPALLAKCAAGVLMLSLCSSAQYILNDLLDLNADREHPTKRRRPFASGALPVAAGIGGAPVLLAISLAAAFSFSKIFALALAIYSGTSLLYSFYLKRIVLLDAFVLAGLYVLRIVAGNLITGIAFSVWLLAFAFFVFLSLAFMKRLTELNNSLPRASGSISRRGYHREDAHQVNVLGVSSAFMATVVFILYLQSDAVRELYRQPVLLWLLAPMFLYWVSRIWILSSRGELHEDPVLFALTDGVTYAVAGLAGLVMMAATAGWLDGFAG